MILQVEYLADSEPHQVDTTGTRNFWLASRLGV